MTLPALLHLLFHTADNLQMISPNTQKRVRFFPEKLRRTLDAAVKSRIIIDEWELQ
jgi:hypothetical protein